MFKACNTIYDHILVDSFYPTTFVFSAYDVIERSTYGNLVVLSVLVLQLALGSNLSELLMLVRVWNFDQGHDSIHCDWVYLYIDFHWGCACFWW